MQHLRDEADALSFGSVLTAQMLFKVCSEDCRFTFRRLFNDVYDKQHNGNIQMCLLISKLMESHFKPLVFSVFFKAMAASKRPLNSQSGALSALMAPGAMWRKRGWMEGAIEHAAVHL